MMMNPHYFVFAAIVLVVVSLATMLARCVIEVIHKTEDTEGAEDDRAILASIAVLVAAVLLLLMAGASLHWNTFIANKVLVDRSEPRPTAIVERAVCP